VNDGKDIDWAVLPENAKRIQFDAPSGPLAVVTLGDPNNPRVVLVAGITGSKEDFTLMMPELAAAGWFVVSYDLAGQYESAGAGPENMNPPRKHYDYKLFVDDLIAVLDSGVGPSHVLGYSFAGTVSQVAFAQRPDLFASLTFLSCPPQPGQSLRGLRRVGWMSF
jgi:pimeloyl-ACP methyl ester carboxylesterase